MKEKVTFHELQTRMSNFNLSFYQANICSNMKRIRKKLYEENNVYYKENNKKNPYSTQSVAELLGISHEYYKRLESFDKSKPISLKLVLKIMVLLNCNISDLLGNE